MKLTLVIFLITFLSVDQLDNPTHEVKEIVGTRVRRIGKKVVRDFLVIWDDVGEKNLISKQSKILWNDEEKVMEFIIRRNSDWHQ